MPRIFKKALAFLEPKRNVIAQLDLVDRSGCPSFLNLTGLTEDPELYRYIRAQVRQIKADFQDSSVFPDSSQGSSCNCGSARTSHWQLARKIKDTKAGWQDELAQSLLPYVLSHLSASIVGNVYEALAVDQPLTWQAFPPCDVRQNRNNPSFVLEAAGWAIRARIKRRPAAIKGCVITGAFLNVIKRHWLGCEWFRGGHTGSFPEQKYLQHELLQEALDTYLEDPTQETFAMSADTLRWSLAALPCPLRAHHPDFHHVQQGPAAEGSKDKALQSSSDQ
ncbi:hypothetical protein KVR01_012369 [Diaporthe batatas]|uniref:uncharacterized protein n=1 Tax=Diaporthe batatas TaxID=748121 RepID=UPI001D05A85E|nr:uncharacterized protein KVR01_012369 [Diaporthe batatas]KAG8157707.1 hypothetical protein KVR01_012369 [Diaporthe batatas]